MPKDKSILSELFKLTGIIQRKDTPNPTPTISVGQTVSITSNEQSELLKRVAIPRAKDFQNPTIDPKSLITYLKPIQENIASRKFDNYKLKTLAPEIQQAMTIMIPSIMSPNDLQDGKLSLGVEHEQLSEKARAAIGDRLTEYFGSTLNLDKKLPSWIKTMMYETGAKPVLILPELLLSTMIKNEKMKGTESFDVVLNSLFQDKLYSKNSVVGIETFSSVINKSDISEYITEIINEDTDNNNNNSHNGINKKNKTDNDVKNTEAFIKTASEYFSKALFENEMVEIVENPLVVGLCSLRKDLTTKKLETQLDKFFDIKKFDPKKEEIISLVDIIGNDKDKLTNNATHPVLYELPAESIVPIFVSGSPETHVGYYLMIDDQGNPIDALTDSIKKESGLGNPLNSSFQAMFSTFGQFENMGMLNSSKQNKMLNKVYEYMLDKFLALQLNNMGVTNISIGENNEVYKCMFRRLLAHKKTKLLFIPESLLVYYAFDYNDDGTGRSKLEDIKFIMSLRVTLMVSRIMAAMDTAINRQKLDIEFDEGVANPLSIMNDVKNKFIESKVINFSYDPSTIVKSIAQRGLSIVPKNIPGINAFNITEESNAKTNVTPDNELMEDLTNMFILGLEVPPSALNNLSEAEYARSVATTNLFFSKKIKDYQFTICEFTKKLVKIYLKYSTPLREELLSLLSKIEKDVKDKNDNIPEDNTDVDLNDKDDDVKTSDGSASEDDNADDANEKLLNEIIDSIEVWLPSPNIAPDKAQFEEAKVFDEAIETLLNGIFAPTMFEADRELGEQMTTIKALIKSTVLRRYIQDSGMGELIDIPNIQDFDTSEFIHIMQAVMNFRKHVDDTKRVLKPSDDEGDENDSEY